MSIGIELWSHYRSNGCALDAVLCQSHLKCERQMSVKRFITRALSLLAPPQFLPCTHDLCKNIHFVLFEH